VGWKDAKMEEHYRKNYQVPWTPACKGQRGKGKVKLKEEEEE